MDSGSSHRRWSQNSRSQILGALSPFKKTHPVITAKNKDGQANSPNR